MDLLDEREFRNSLSAEDPLGLDSVEYFHKGTPRLNYLQMSKHNQYQEISLS